MEYLLFTEAAQNYRTALAVTGNEAARRYLCRRLDEVEHGCRS